jgi:carbonic anhydrase
MEADWHLAFGDWKNSATVTRTDAANKAETFTPQGMVWHTPSEHTVDGRHFAAEAQVMSTDEAGVVSITSFFFDNVDQDTDNGFVKSFLQGYDNIFRSIDVN